MAELAELEKTIGVSFKNKALLGQALVHSSYCNENPALAPESNERLEFFGDAVLGFIIAEKLYREHPTLPEGALSKLRAELVRRETLAEAAGRIKLGGHLYLGRGEESTGGRDKAANLASALEALIAAVFLDRGMSATRVMVLDLLQEEIVRVASAGEEVNYKSLLQEILQSRRQPPPSYRTVEDSGPAHEKTFVVEVIASGVVRGVGRGKNKKAAEMLAARQALGNMNVTFTV